MSHVSAWAGALGYYFYATDTQYDNLLVTTYYPHIYMIYNTLGH